MFFIPKTALLTPKSCYSALENCKIQANTFQKDGRFWAQILGCTATPEKCDFQKSFIQYFLFKCVPEIR